RMHCTARTRWGRRRRCSTRRSGSLLAIPVCLTDEHWRMRSQATRRRRSAIGHGPLSSTPARSHRRSARGWLALRRDRPSEAAAHFEQAERASSKERWASIGLAVAKVKLGDAAQATAALEQVPEAKRQALDLAYLAEALLALGDTGLAERTTTDAIDELDSIHGRSWIVRAEARRLLGDIDGAARDYNKALSASDEPWIEQHALGGLESIDRPVEER